MTNECIEFLHQIFLEARCYAVRIKQDTDSKVLLQQWFTFYFQVLSKYQLIPLCKGQEGDFAHHWPGPPVAKGLVCSASLSGLPLEQGNICLT